MTKYISVREEDGKNFFMHFRNKGVLKMLNLLRFREVADYSLFSDLKPEGQISGKEAYYLYMENTIPLLENAGSKLLFHGSCGDFLIGPPDEKWDYMLLVEHRSVEDFIKFADNPSYQAIAGHRTAALEESRLLPIQ